jgi:DHA2 family multidrug resistance protein
VRPAAAPPVFLVTLTVLLGVMMAVIDSSIINVAVSDMAGTLGATVDEVGWVITGYILASIIVMPLNGWLTARFGRRTFYAGSVLLFTLASFLCGTATSVWQLVAYRVLQGIGGGALQPTAQAILFESYPPAKRSTAMAIFGFSVMFGPAIGPTLGGVIVDNFSWPLIFYINLPIGAAAILMTLAFIRDPSYIERDTSPVDWLGLGLLSAGLASLQYVLERGQREDWFDSQTIVLATTIAAVTLVWFVIRQLRSRYPLVDLHVFRSRAFTAGNVIGVVTGFGVYGLNLATPLFYQNVMRLDATNTGLALIPGSIATALSMPIAGRVTGRVDVRYSVTFGCLLFALGAWMMGGMTGDAGYWDVFWPRALQGFALGFLWVPVTTAALADIPRAELSNATGLYTLIRQLGGSLGIAVLTFLEERHESSAYATLTAGVSPANGAVAQLLARAPNPTRALQELAALVHFNAQTIAYNDLFRLSGVLFIAALPTVLLLRSARAPRERLLE